MILVSIMFAASCIGNGISGIVADRMGRKFALIIANLVLLLSWVVTFFATNFPALLIGRIVMGIACGVAFSASFIIQSEICLIAYRGTIGSLNNVTWNVGFAIGLVVGAILPLQYYAIGIYE